MSPKELLFSCLLVWVIILTLAIRGVTAIQRQSLGLVAAFVCMIAVMHSGALAHLLIDINPQSHPYLRSLGYDIHTVATGFFITTYASLVFVLASQFIPIVSTSAVLARVRTLGFGVTTKYHAKLLVTVGFASFGIVLFFGRVGIELTGLQAILTAARNLLVPGLIVLMYYYIVSHRKLAAAFTLVVLLFILPGTSLLLTGILADTVSIMCMVALVVVKLYLSPSKFRGPLIALAFITVIFIGYAFSVYWIQSRGALRELISEREKTSIVVQRMQDSINEFQAVDLSLEKNIPIIDARLNQNIFIGLAAERHKESPDLMEGGRTISAALFGWIPRALWPDKPTRGSTELLSKHTGLTFSHQTSFGMGPIFELYINYGYLAVTAGFMVIGIFLGILDRISYWSLIKGNVGVLATALPMGLVFLDPLIDLVSLTTSVAAACIVGIATMPWVRIANSNNV